MKKKYGLFTKREVKMPGYSPSPFVIILFFYYYYYCVFMYRDGVNGHKHAKKRNEANIQPS